MRKTLIVLDPELPDVSLELLTVMDEIYGPEGSLSYALSLETPTDVRMSDHRVGGAFDYVIRLEGDALESHDAVAAASCIEELHEEHRFNAILIPATPFGRMLAPRAAMRLRVGLVADVTGIRRRGDEVEMVRPAFSGRMLAGVVSVGPGPLMMTVRRNVFSAAHRGLKPTTMLYHGPRTPHGSRVRLVERRERDVSSDIRESDVLVSGGGGVERSFDRLEALARALGGMVSASRKVVDSGTAPRRIQVGQSGRTVSPRLYLALGISGSIQHVVGLKSAEHVIAVNTDRHAPICALSDIVVEGDAREFIPRLLERIEQGAPAASNTARGEAR